MTAPSCSWACALLAEVADVRFTNGTVGAGCLYSGESIQVCGEMVGMNLRGGFHVSSGRHGHGKGWRAHETFGRGRSLSSARGSREKAWSGHVSGETLGEVEEVWRRRENVAEDQAL